MDSYGRFYEILQSVDEFEFGNYEDEPDGCVFARKYHEWVDKLWQDILGNEPDLVVINQAKVLIMDKYYEFRASVPKNHRDRLGHNGHTCIFQVFLQTYEKLKAIELSITPPLLFLPSQLPPDTPMADFGGTLIGLVDD